MAPDYNFQNLTSNRFEFAKVFQSLQFVIIQGEFEMSIFLSKYFKPLHLLLNTFKYSKSEFNILIKRSILTSVTAD